MFNALMRKETAQQILQEVRDQYNSIAESFSDTRERPWPEMETFAKQIKPGDRVLDIGCGNGRMYQILQNKSILYQGIDVSEALTQRAREKYGERFDIGSFLDLPYSDASYDAVISVATLHHIPSNELRLQAIRQAYRVLKPGGVFMMTNWNRWKLQYIGNFFQTWWRKLSGSGEDWNDHHFFWKRGPQRARRYYHAFSYREIDRLCRTAGFSVLNNYPVHRTYPNQPWWHQRGESMVTLCRK